MSTWVAEFKPTSDGRFFHWSVEDRDDEYSTLTGTHGWARTMWGAKRKARRAIRRATRDEVRRKQKWAQIDALTGRIQL